MGGCLVCRQLSGEIDLPGGFLWDDGEAVAFLSPTHRRERVSVSGSHCLVVTRRHVDHLSDLSATEAASVGAASRMIAAALRAEGVERVHVAVIGSGVPHFHQHLYPRYPGVPAGTSWMDVDGLPDAPHGGPSEIVAFADRLRKHITN